MYMLILLYVFASGGTSSETVRSFSQLCDCEAAKRALEKGTDNDKFTGVEKVGYYECRPVPPKKK